MTGPTPEPMPTVPGLVASVLEMVVGTYRRCAWVGRLDARFVASWAYIVAFIITRGTTTVQYLLRQDVHTEYNGIHIHHMVFGLILVLLAGLLGVDVWQRVGWLHVAQGLAFGIGAAVVLDEFCLILFVEDNYWRLQGVLVSEAALVVFAAVLFVDWRIGRPYYGAARRRLATLMKRAR